MAKSVQALVKPELLVWARKSAGLTIQQAARKAEVTDEQIAGWENGTSRPTISQLRKLAAACKRPLAVFYLPSPPAGADVLHDFRRLPGGVPEQLSPQLIWEIRRARERREAVLNLLEGLEELPRFSLHADLSEDSERLGSRIRGFLGIQRDVLARLPGKHDALDYWRSALERAGVLVFQASGVPTSEMRGFSLSESPLPVIVVNSKDSPLGRIFSMAHEVVHVMLTEGGLCDLGETERPPEESTKEVFCNRTAGAALLPADDLLQEPLVIQKTRGARWSDAELDQIARRYRVSREVVLRRLLIHNRITREFYAEKNEELRAIYSGVSREESGPVPPYRRALSSVGAFFTSVVLDSYHRERITASDVSDLLGIRLKHLGRLEEALLRKSVGRAS